MKKVLGGNGKRITFAVRFREEKLIGRKAGSSMTL